MPPQQIQAPDGKLSDVKPSLPLFKVQLYLTFSKATPDATEKAWSNALDELKKDRTFERIYRAYPPSNPLPGPANNSF